MALAAYKYENNPTVFDATSNKAFTSEQEFLSAGGNFGSIQTRPTEANAGFYKNDGSDTVYNSQTNQPYYNADQFQAAGGNWANIQIKPTTTTNTNVLQEQPKTTLDIQSLIQQNQQMQTQYLTQQQTYQNEYLSALKDPGALVTNLQNTLNGLNQQIRDTALSRDQGIANVENKTIPMQFITGQATSIAKQANLQLQALSNAGATITDQLRLAQQARSTLLEGLRTQMEFGRDNFATQQDSLRFQIELQKYQIEFEQIAKQEQAAAKEFALENGIALPYYNIGGVIYRTSDGLAFTSEEHFKQVTGQDIGKVEAAGQIHKVEPAAPEAATSDIAEYQFAKTQGYAGTFQQWVDRTSQYNPNSGGGGGGGGVSQVEQYAQDVFNGNLSLTGVPIKIRAQVSAEVEKLRNSRYDSEFDARLDYDSEVRQLEAAIRNPENTIANPTQIISSLTTQFGKFISKEEIEATILNLFGAKQRPTTTTTTQPASGLPQRKLWPL